MDLKSLIRLWETKGTLKRINQPVSQDLEITEIYRRVFCSQGPALIFENVVGTSMPLVINIFGTWERIWDAFGVDSEEALLERFAPLLRFDVPQGLMGKAKALLKLKDLSGLFPRETKKALCHETILKGDKVDLGLLPVMKSWPDDAGRFITLPVVITKDPDTGRENLGMYRMQVIDRNKTALHWHPAKGGEIHHRKAREKKRRLEVACAIGCEPAVIYAATAPLPPDVSELLFAGLLMDRPVEVVQGLTVGLNVPATSQVVLEGYVEEGEVFSEGPFGDHTGYYTPPRQFPVFHIEAMTFAHNPLYASIAVGWPPLEDAFLGKLTEKLFLPFIRFVMPEIRDMNLPVAGLFHNFAFVSIQKRYPGHAYKVMDGLWGLGQMSATKVIVVFDSHVDVQNMDEVLFHLGNNIDPLRDIIIKKGPVDILDHASLNEGFGGKMGIDATKKLSEEGLMRPWPERALMDEETVKKVDGIWKTLGL
jgi:4-hydroxy-3-polyprenylbenzoate decarboxylase